MTTFRGADTHIMTTRSPEDVLAAVPLVLGFVPEESVVMLTFGAEDPFHGRLDLPRTTRERRAAAKSLLRPALLHDVSRVLFVLYTGDAAGALSCAAALVRAFTGSGIDVGHVLRSDGRHWFVVPLDGSAREGPGTPYDVSGHLFTAQAVASGRVTRSCRAELAATVAADHDAARAVTTAARALAIDDPAAEAAWAPATARWLIERGPPDPATAARLLVALREPLVRDAVLSIDRRTASSQLALWSGLVRVAPVDLVAPVASVLAFLAWLAGDGALAWCALDRAGEGEPSCSLAAVVAEALERALPPSLWERR